MGGNDQSSTRLTYKISKSNIFLQILHSSWNSAPVTTSGWNISQQPLVILRIYFIFNKFYVCFSMRTVWGEACRVVRASAAVSSRRILLSTLQPTSQLQTLPGLITRALAAVFSNSLMCPCLTSRIVLLVSVLYLSYLSATVY